MRRVLMVIVCDARQGNWAILIIIQIKEAYFIFIYF